MRILILFLFFCILTFYGNSQACWILNDNAFINIANNSYLVIDNGKAEAITQKGTGGNIVSEKETNVIKWNIGSTIGNYVIPFTNTDKIKIPVEINITSAGDVNGSFILSTYRTDNMNSVWPTVPPEVTNMCSSLHPTDASYFVVDRFWRIDVGSYNSKPAVIMSLGYDFINEADGDNTISGESSLQAQRFNPTIGTSGTSSCHGTNVTGNWENLTFGYPNTTTKQVNNIIVSPNNFFKDWILVDNATPLPVKLLNFDALCENDATVLKWTTASENNNDFFSIEKSTDGINFYEIGVIKGSGNSSSLISYSFADNTRNTPIKYYRLIQVDYDGQKEYFDVISSTCSSKQDFVVENELFGNNSLQFSLHSINNDRINISLYDYTGKKVGHKNTTAKAGENHIEISDLYLVSGIYILHIEGKENQIISKLFKQ